MPQATGASTSRPLFYSILIWFFMLGIIFRNWKATRANLQTIYEWYLTHIPFVKLKITETFAHALQKVKESCGESFCLWNVLTICISKAMRMESFKFVKTALMHLGDPFLMILGFISIAGSLVIWILIRNWNHLPYSSLKIPETQQEPYDLKELMLSPPHF